MIYETRMIQKRNKSNKMLSALNQISMASAFNSSETIKPR
jgi:hypothetical protein